MKSNKCVKKTRFLGALAAFALGLGASEAATPPTTISYKGYLTDSAGIAMTGATLGMKVEMFESASGGSATYGEIHGGITPIDGHFDLLLGNGTATTGSWPCDFSKALWLQITMDPSGTPETLLPRIPLTAVPYAQTAFVVTNSAVDHLTLELSSGGT